MPELRKITVKIPKDTYEIIEKMAQKRGENFSETVRSLLNDSLYERWTDENDDKLTRLIRQQMEIVIKPHIERLASLNSKTGHMASTATFLNVQAFMDLIPNQKKDVRVLYEKARKKAVEYMKTKTTEFENDL